MKTVFVNAFVFQLPIVVVVMNFSSKKQQQVVCRQQRSKVVLRNCSGRSCFILTLRD
ncbi:hypothetical protein SISNIDRAFT_173544 [Sistotremastrum niveocremeum HHB9708]|uniref:Uncharacterized protein n=1 Tax=Sistotremastrum niveocremeum HHB9708 TaxID=1314777 RepID=A0A164RVE4_9AGAM|nr:hypothetical protein SISNIDRAFT_173544 [Sistotremastrum niveocremeum HHB9708]